ncbi:MAG: hypothetical protein M1836_003451 [Candelina mexicana]|nr:MAG: hypothetical protein M1836_003451 [Candelina mexicana]
MAVPLSSSNGHDAEKGLTSNDPMSPTTSIPSDGRASNTTVSRLAKWNAKIESLSGLEVRGISRVLPTERHEASAFGFVQMALLWFSSNLTANNLAVGMLGPLVLDLGFLDAALCAVFGSILGSMGTAYMSTWGPQSGNRTMIVARYFMGFYPSKIPCLLNIVIMVGYGTIDCIIGGQILSAVADSTMSVIVGIVIVALITWAVATFGMFAFHLYAKWAWAPQVLVLFVLIGSAGPKFNTTITSKGDPTTINANRLSFFSLCLSAPISWAAASADYYVYYPENTPKYKTFAMTLTGLVLSFSIVTLLGVGLASGTFNNSTWASANKVSSGALILAGYEGLGGFGKFCGVVVALGVIANNIPGTYSSALGIQVLGRYGFRIPRWACTTVIAAIYTTCALGGRNNLFEIFENFLALMGYWLTIFVCIVLEEHLLFRRRRGFDWDAWNERSRLPIGLAALTAFLVGWAGAIISMSQAWYVSPLAKMIGEKGADLGIWVGCAWTLITFPPLRWAELTALRR